MATTLQLALSGIDQNGNPYSIPGTAVWASTYPLVASVSQTGLVTRGTMPGTTQITATVGSVVSTIATITVPAVGGTALSLSVIVRRITDLYVDARPDIIDILHTQVPGLAGETRLQAKNRTFARVLIITPSEGHYDITERIDLNLADRSAPEIADIKLILERHRYVVETP